ncbi:RagB/SusD family nutrient uptake outer membrane protein [Polaribacter sp. Z014]|uniref:RagB/SusD family nutrient uptake outer membrane protein n=1 Tax=Polaribacter sp. Z014 TaxID=2927126 RepID=UPI0020207FA3|nr:RagB/SusD family nutrient uptake outer membrane protein [Polaribacter sp. Z014]MCL7765080.1 RagB/SusD family nutrient uptake outer membrane protein [Polaribacter sp. Z014]
MYTKNKFIKYLSSSSITIILLVIAVSLQNCVNLDEDPTKSQLAPGKFSSLEDFNLGVTGVYGKLRTAAQWTTFNVFGWAGDDITTHKALNKAPFREYDQMNVAGDNPRSLSNWKDVYSMIRAVNAVIESAQGLEVADKDGYNTLLGESHFIRGTLFLHMSRIHGRIPLPLTSTPDFDIKLATQIEVYEQIEADLLLAESLLPVIYPDVLPGAPRPNKGSAEAMLSRLYMNWAGFPVKDNSKYTDAANISKKVIDNHAAHGFELLSDLNDLWKVENRFNEESVWTIAYNNPAGLGNRKYGILGYPSDVQGGWSEVFAEVRFFEDFPEGPRKEATYRTDLDWKNFKDQVQPIFAKVAGPIGDLPSQWSTDRNDFYMRYAEVLLNYAEASGRAGTNSTDAWEALNKIRRRAAGNPFNTPDPSVDITSGDLAELAFTERKWEFAGEFLRYNDLVRMEKVAEALSNEARTPLDTNIPIANPVLGSLSSDNYYAPIPQIEIELNPNLGN